MMTPFNQKIMVEVSALGFKAFFSYLIISYALEPTCAFLLRFTQYNSQYTDWFSEVFAYITTYDFRVETVANKMYIASFLGFMSMALVCSCLDVMVQVFNLQGLKSQGATSLYSFAQFRLALGVSLLTVTLSHWLGYIPTWFVWRGLHGDSALFEGANWVWFIELLKVLVIGTITEFYMYFVHRALHHPSFYKHVHKLHHEFTAPFAGASGYVHPLEYVLNIAGFCLPVALCNPHPWTIYLLFGLRQVESVAEHSGFLLFACKHHDLHHEFSNVNYGPFGIVDAVMGTDYESNELSKSTKAAKIA